jgi:hypothetical protein
MMTETDPVSEMLSSLEHQTMEKVQKLVIPSTIHHHNNPAELTTKAALLTYYELRNILCLLSDLDQ